MYSNNINWETVFRDEFHRFLSRNPGPREIFRATIHNDQRYADNLLPDLINTTEGLVRDRIVRDVGTGMECAIHMHYFDIILSRYGRHDPVDDIIRYDREIPADYVNKILSLMNIQVPSHYPQQGRYPQHNQPQGREYGGRSPGRPAPIAPAPVNWSQSSTAGARSAPYQANPPPDTYTNTPTSVHESESRLVTITRQRVTFSVMSTIDKKGKQVNSEDHKKFYEDVLASEVIAEAPTGTLADLDSDSLNEDILEFELTTPKMSRLVDTIITENDGGNEVFVLNARDWFTAFDSDTLTKLNSRRDDYLYTGITNVENKLGLLTSDKKKIDIAVNALSNAKLENIDTLLTGLVNNGVVSNIETILLRENIIEHINSICQTRLGLSPGEFVFDLIKYVPKDVNGYMDSFINGIRSVSTSALINEIDIEAELNRGVSDIVGSVKLSEDGKSIVLSRVIGVGYISVNIDKFPFGETIVENGYVTTDVVTLRETAETIKGVIRDYDGEYILMTKDGYLLSISTIAPPRNRNSARNNAWGGVLFIKQIGVNMMSKQLQKLYTLTK